MKEAIVFTNSGNDKTTVIMKNRLISVTKEFDGTAMIKAFAGDFKKPYMYSFYFSKESFEEILSQFE